MAFRLFDLPPELRVQIYEYLLLELGDFGIITLSRISDEKGRNHDSRTQPALLQVNRQIRAKACPIYYRKYVFVACSSEQMEAWLATSPAKASYVQSILQPCPHKEHHNLQLDRCGSEPGGKRSDRMPWRVDWRCDEDLYEDEELESVEYDEVPECLCSERRIEEAAAVHAEVEADEGWRVALGLPLSDEDYADALKRYVRVFQDREEDLSLVCGL